jgi:hypothetical protein
MNVFTDLADLPEDERITVIAESARAGNTVAVFVDDDQAADRYAAKLEKLNVRVIDRAANVLVAGTVLLRVGPKGH